MSVTHSGLAAALAVDGCVAIIAGKVQGKAPVEGIPLTKEERDRLKIEDGNLAVFYPVGEDGVFLAMGGSAATVWFNGGDCEQGLGVFEAALKRAYPAARQLQDVVNPNDNAMRARGYQVELGDGKVAVIDVAYPGPGAKGTARQLAIRVFAQRRSG